MTDARLRMSLDLDTAQARAEVAKFAAESANATAQAFSAAEKAAVARSLGVRPSDPMVQQILQRGTMQGGPPPTVGPPPSVPPPPPYMSPQGRIRYPEGEGPMAMAHAHGLQQVAHSARAVADTMLYRVSPALGEVHRAAAGMLLMSGNAMLMLAGVGLSAATIIGIQLFGALLKARKETEEFAKALRSGDVGQLTTIEKKRTKELEDLEYHLETTTKADAKFRAEAGPGAISPFFENPDIVAGIAKAEIAGLQKDIGAKKKSEEDVNREIEARDLQAFDSKNKRKLELDRLRISQSAKLEEGESALRLSSAKALMGLAGPAFGFGDISLGEFQATRRRALEQERDEELAQSRRHGDARRRDLVRQLAGEAAEITARESRLEGVADPAVARKITAEIAARKGAAAKLQEEVAFLDEEGALRRRTIEQKYNTELAKDSATVRQETLKGESDLFEHRRRLGDVSLGEEISRARAIAAGQVPGRLGLPERRAAAEDAHRLDRELDQAHFDIKRALGETTLQEELGRIETLIAREVEGSQRRLQLEREHASKVKEIRDRSEGAATTAIGIATEEYAKQLKAAGVENPETVAREYPLTDAQIAALNEQARARSRQMLDIAGAGGGVSAEQRLAALRLLPQQRELAQLGGPAAVLAQAEGSALSIGANQLSIGAGQLLTGATELREAAQILKGGQPGEPGGPPGESTRPGEPGDGVGGGEFSPGISAGIDANAAFVNEAFQSDAQLAMINARLGRAKLATKRASEDVAWASNAVFIGPGPVGPEATDRALREQATSDALRPELGMPPRMDVGLGGSPEATQAALDKYATFTPITMGAGWGDTWGTLASEASEGMRTISDAIRSGAAPVVQSMKEEVTQYLRETLFRDFQRQ